MSMANLNTASLGVHWHDARLVGKVINRGTPEFGYTREWLATRHNLSPIKVPFDEPLYHCSDKNFEQLPGFLSDCLPDQWGNGIMMRDFIRDNVQPTPLNMLAWVGSRGIGALSFKPAILDESGSKSWDRVTPLLLCREAQEVLRKSPPEAYVHLREAGTAGGAFPKASVALLPDGTMLCNGNVASKTQEFRDARLGIIKLDCEDDPARPSTDGRMEYAYMLMARASGIRTAKCEVLKETADPLRPRYHFFVDRFDVVAGNQRRLHLTTLAGLHETYNLSYRHFLSTARTLSQNRAELLEGVRRMIFNVRAGNADDHAKNHSFIYDDTTNRWSFSPAYDLTLNYSLDQKFNGLSEVTFGKSPRVSALLELVSEFGVTESDFKTIDDEVKKSIASWSTFAQQAGLSSGDEERARSLHELIAGTLEAPTPFRKTTKRKRIF